MQSAIVIYVWKNWSYFQMWRSDAQCSSCRVKRKIALQWQKLKRVDYVLYPCLSILQKKTERGLCRTSAINMKGKYNKSSKWIIVIKKWLKSPLSSCAAKTNMETSASLARTCKSFKSRDNVNRYTNLPQCSATGRKRRLKITSDWFKVYWSTVKWVFVRVVSC